MNIEYEDIREIIEVELETTNKDSLTLKNEIDPFESYDIEKKDE